jgi:hypothetical protein
LPQSFITRIQSSLLNSGCIARCFSYVLLHFSLVNWLLAVSALLNMFGAVDVMHLVVVLQYFLGTKQSIRLSCYLPVLTLYSRNVSPFCNESILFVLGWLYFGTWS